MFAVLKPKFTQVQNHEFIKGRFSGFGKDSALIGWLVSSLLLVFHALEFWLNMLSLDLYVCNLYKCHVSLLFPLIGWLIS